MARICILAIGAHPDDIEIGAAALVSKAAGLGMAIYFLILTDGPDDGAARRKEATKAAAILGLKPDQVLFAGMRDGRLRADSKSVSRVREIVANAELKPDLIVTHTMADSHNDHFEANRIARGAFRECTFLQFSIHLSSEPEQFAPRIFVKMTNTRLTKKTKALAQHHSQRARLERRDLAKYEARLGRLARMERAEAFEVSLQEGATDIFDQIFTLSESPFHQFWSRVIDRKSITLFYESYTVPGAAIDWPSSQANLGRDQLRRAFRDQWLPHSPLHEAASSDSSVQQKLETGSVILAGGPVGNLVVRELYNRFRGTLWAIEYEMPRQEHAYLYNRVTGARHYPKYDSKRNVVEDYGVIARVANPYAPGECVLCAAGATGYGTSVALEFLSDPASVRDIAKHFESRDYVQVAFRVKPGSVKINILDAHHAKPR